jgi:hypothetical protein
VPVRGEATVTVIRMKRETGSRREPGQCHGEDGQSDRVTIPPRREETSL